MFFSFPIYSLFVEWVIGQLENSEFKKGKETVDILLGRKCQIIEKPSLNFSFGGAQGIHANCENLKVVITFLNVSGIINEIRIKILLEKQYSIYSKIKTYIELADLFKNVLGKIYSIIEPLEKLKSSKLGILYVGIPENINSPLFAPSAGWQTGFQQKLYFLKKQQSLGKAISVSIEPDINIADFTLAGYRFIFDASLVKLGNLIDSKVFSFNLLVNEITQILETLHNYKGGL